MENDKYNMVELIVSTDIIIRDSIHMTSYITGQEYDFLIQVTTWV
jgi:hypothetical protein